MSETLAHRRARIRAAGSGGRTEVPLPGGPRLDALTQGRRRATEVERSGIEGRSVWTSEPLKIFKNLRNWTS